MPFKQTEPAGFGAVSEVMRLVMSWMEALHDRGELDEPVSSLLSLVTGLRGSVLRLRLDTFAQTTIAEAPLAVPVGLPGPSRMSFSQYLLGHGISKAQAGSVWYLSDFSRELLDDDRSELEFSRGDRRTREIVAAVLEPGTLSSDILEIHFPRWLSSREKEALGMLVAFLSRSWSQRSSSVFLETVPELHAEPDQMSARSVLSILSSRNPAGLSKAEYRVCTLLSRGLSAKAISGSLKVSESTVRSHLRGIYAKTKTEGQRELMYQLLGAATQVVQSDRVLVRATGGGRVSDTSQCLPGQRSRT